MKSQLCYVLRFYLTEQKVQKSRIAESNVQDLLNIVECGAASGFQKFKYNQIYKTRFMNI